MTPAEWWAEFDTKQAEQKRLTAPQSSFGHDAWAEARRKHKERKRDGTLGP